MRLALRAFSGIAPRLDPRRLPETNAQTAKNCDLRNGTLRALLGTTATWTPTKVGTIKTIYRFGQTLTNEAQYWFHWLDDVDVARGQIAGDTEERTYYTGDSTFGHPRVTKSSIALSGGTNYPMNSYRLGVPAPNAAPTSGGVTGTGTGEDQTRAYVYTYVTGDMEEGPPSLPVYIVAKEGQTVSLTGLLTNISGSYNITNKRIYRTVWTGGTPTDYQFVAEVALATATYSDSKLATELGESLPSLNWYPPPDGLKGLVNMPNGMMAGFLGNDVYFCEPFRPFAWPPDYMQTVDTPIVGLGVISETLVVLTKGRPCIMFGSDPNAITTRYSALPEACVSKRSIVSMPGGVMYASPNGLVMITSGGGTIVTEGIIDKQYWATLKPESIAAYQYDGRYVGFYDTGTVTGGFQLDPADGNQPFSLFDAFALAGYNDLVRDALYLNIGGAIVKWDSGSPYTYTWRSRINEAPHPVNFGWGQVVAAAYPVTARIYAGGALKHTESVANGKPFRLPSGFTESDWEIEVTGTAKITAINLAQGIDELRAE
jgi:hypothetical protein